MVDRSGCQDTSLASRPTCPELDKDVKDVNEVADVVQAQPEGHVIFLQLPEDCPSNNHDDVVEDGGRYYPQPAIVEGSGWIYDPVLPVAEL